MLKKLKQYWTYVIAGVVALAYLIGLKKGKRNEEIRQDKTILENVARANRARIELSIDPTMRDRLHKKYRK